MTSATGASSRARIWQRMRVSSRQGSRGLGLPMRRDSPAAVRIADTPGIGG